MASVALLPRLAVSLGYSAQTHASFRRPSQSAFPRSAKVVRCSAGSEQSSGSNGSLTGRSRTAGDDGIGPSSVDKTSNGASSSSSRPVATPSAAAALRALDAQLLELAQEERKKRGGDGGRGESRTSGGVSINAGPSSDSGEKPFPQIGRNASGDGWPEFDATFFTYSSIILLVVTFLSNLVYSWAAKTFAPEGSPAPAAQEEQPRSAMSLMIQRKLSEGAAMNALNAENPINARAQGREAPPL